MQAGGANTVLGAAEGANTVLGVAGGENTVLGVAGECRQREGCIN